MLDPAVTLALLVAAIAHATWNAIVHAIADKLLAMALLGMGGALCAVPLLVLAPAPAAAAWPFLAASVVVQLAYNLLLMQSYRLGDFGQMYPVARGVSPLVVTISAAVFVGEVPTAGGLLGVLVIFGGLASLVLAGRRIAPVTSAGRRSGRVTPAALAAAVGTGLTIATYTTIDGIGARHSGSPAGYVGWLLAIEGAAISVITAAARRRELAAVSRSVLGRGVLGGALSLLAYGLVVWAQTRGALAPVAALRETSVIAAAVIGTLFFKEPFGRARVTATVLVAAGIVLLTV